MRFRAQGFHISCKRAIATYGIAATSAIEAEMKQMLDKDVFIPVDRRVLTREQIRTILSSSIFVKEKFMPAGDFDKLKARFVGGGNWQDRDDYLDVSSPAAALASLMMVVAIAARERRKVRSLDVDGAYLCALMETCDRRHASAYIGVLICERQTYCQAKARIVWVYRVRKAVVRDRQAILELSRADRKSP